jgi:hypothetical protein
MKKIHFIYHALFVLSVATVLVISPLKAVSQQSAQPKSSSIPDDVDKILGKSCIGCHDTNGKKMAAFMWSYSSWDKYSPKKQARKSKAMCNAITKEKMPPKPARKEHPEKIPTAAQIETLCKWSASLRQK